MDYALPNHVYTCATDAGVVVLDARTGKYSIVPSDRARTLEGVVRGWPAIALPEGPAGDLKAPSSVLDSLVRGGIVTTVSDSGSRTGKRPAMFVAAETILNAMDAQKKPKIHARHVLAFSMSVLYATVMLKRRSFERLINDLRGRKERVRKNMGELSISHVRECVRVFSWLRPFGYAESGACLFDSVVLMDFLFRQGVPADFLIGVRIRPFVAHAWVQAQGFALNGLPEYLGAYTPLLLV
jgi:hypothetical protein